MTRSPTVNSARRGPVTSPPSKVMRTGWGPSGSSVVVGGVVSPSTITVGVPLVSVGVVGAALSSSGLRTKKRTSATAAPAAASASLAGFDIPYGGALDGPFRAVRAHERVAVVGRREERLLDRPRRHPADEVPHRTGLVVRPGGARATEGLLGDDGAGRLVVHVEVSGRVAELVLRIEECLAVVGEDRPGEAVGSRPVDEVERVVPLALGVDVGRDDRPEELVPQEAEVRVGRLDHGRLDEVALAVVDAAADEHLRLGVLLRLLDRLLLRLEGVGVDHGAHEVREVGDVADLELPHLLDEPLLQLVPDVGRRVDTRRGG